MGRDRRRVFILLPDHLDVADWRQAWREGHAPDETPYGYHHAEQLGYEVHFSAALSPRRGWAALPFKILRRVCGFDVEHAWNHRRELFSGRADVIWTHTEREFLPVAMLAWVLGRRCSTPMIGQIVWLADEWSRLPAWRRRLYQGLLNRVACCTCHSPDNLRFLTERVGAARARLVEFGIAPALFVARPAVRLTASRPIRVLVLGNDRHRDWPLISRAFARQPGVEVFIASSTFPDALLAGNMTRQSCDWQGIRQRYEWADVVVVPVVPNRHASGLTVMLESVACGKPVVVTETGGLAHYLDHQAVWFVPHGNAEALREQVAALADDYGATRARVENARRQFAARGFDTPGYARRHVQISEELLA